MGADGLILHRVIRSKPERFRVLLHQGRGASHELPAPDGQSLRESNGDVVEGALEGACAQGFCGRSDVIGHEAILMERGDGVAQRRVRGACGCGEFIGAPGEIDGLGGGEPLDGEDATGVGEDVSSHARGE